MKTFITLFLLACLSLTSMAQTRYRFLTPIQAPWLITDTVKINSGPDIWYLYGGATGKLYFDYNGLGSSLFTLTPDGSRGHVTGNYANFSAPSAPGGATVGLHYYNTSAHEMLLYNGSTWDTLQTGSSGGGTFSGDTITFADGSRIFGGGGQLDLQPGPGIPDDNRLSLYSAGSGDSLVLNSNGSRLIIEAPVLHINNYTTFNDSVCLNYIGAGSITGGVYLLLSPTQAIDTGRARTGAIGMRMPLRLIYDQIADTVNGEMRWWYYSKVQNKWVQRYGVITSDPIATDEAHTVQIELLTRYIFDLQKQIDAIKPRRIFTRRSR